MKQHDLVLGYCHTGLLCHPFVESLVNLSFYDAKHNHIIRAIVSVGDAYIPDARNLLVKKFLGLGGDWLLSVDHDMTFPANFADVMLGLAEANPDKKIIGALYFNWLDDKKLWSTWMEKTDKALFTTVTWLDPDCFKELSACGMGATIIHRTVFEEIAKRTQGDNWTWYGHDLYDNGQGPERLGEDLTFCKRAMDAGFKIWGYSGLTLGHVKQQIVDAKTFSDQPWVHRMEV